MTERLLLSYLLMNISLNAIYPARPITLQVVDMPAFDQLIRFTNLSSIFNLILGPTFAILTLLASLNSCANAWIILFFNPNLLQSFMRGTFGRLRTCRSSQQSGVPSTLTDSQRKQFFNNKKLANANNSMHGRPATSVTGLSPLMNRLSPKSECGNNRLNGQQDAMELIPRIVEGRGGNRKVNVVPMRSSLSVRNENNYPCRDSSSAATPIETSSFIGI